MEYLETVFGIILAIVVVVVYFIFKKKKLRLNEINVGPFSWEFDDVEKESQYAEKNDENENHTERIEIVNMPIAGCVGKELSPSLKIRLWDMESHPVKNKKVRIELYDERGLLSYGSYQGQVSKCSDENGSAEFDGIILQKTGRICILIFVDELEEKTEDIDIFPPGLDIDFWNEAIGTELYEKKLDRALRLSS